MSFELQRLDMTQGDPLTKQAITLILQASIESSTESPSADRYVVNPMVTYLGLREGSELGAVGSLFPVSETEMELGVLAVKPELRGAGLGSALLAAIEAEAVRAGANRLTVETLRSEDADTTARLERFYRQRGYVDEQEGPLGPTLSKRLS